MFDTIVYHFPCSDGIASAWVLWRENRNATLVPVKHGMKLKYADFKNKNVVIVDFCFSRRYLLHIAKNSRKTLVLDHHKSAKKETDGLNHPNLEIIFDLDKSGAQLAWNYCRPNEKFHWIIDMIADRDLWIWNYPWTKAVSRATLELGYHQSVEKIEELYQSNKNYTEFIEYGESLVEKDDKWTDQYIKKITVCDFTTPVGTYRVGIPNCPFYMRTEVGNKIMEERSDLDFVLVYTYNFPEDTWTLSFRSGKNKQIDLSAIAKSLPNGGGHPSASGATIYGKNSRPPFPYRNKKGEDLFTYLKIIK